MVKAYSYIRFSSQQQGKGHSYERQLNLAKQYCSENGLELDEELNLFDSGVPAFKGQNIEKGALGQFIEMVKSGIIPTGSFLLVESLDRLSRQSLNDSLSLLLEIVNSGINVVSLDGGRAQVYEKENLDLYNFMSSIMTLSRGHEESRIKSERISKAWNNKIKNAENKPITRWVPSWLYVSSDGKKILKDEERCRVVEMIFDLCIEGYGYSLIVKELDEKGIEPWGGSKGVQNNSRQPKRWHTSYINRVLTDRKVLGEYRPRDSEVEVYSNYYPQVISEEKFYQAQNALSKRRTGGAGSGPKGEFVTNLFSGLLKCGYSVDSKWGRHRCDGVAESMIVANKGDAVHYLQCSRIKYGNKGCDLCRRKYWRYPDFETAFLNHIKELNIEALLGNKSDLEKQVELASISLDKCKGQIKEIEQQEERIVNTIVKGFEENPPEVLNRKLVELEDQKKSLNQRAVSLKQEKSLLEKKAAKYRSKYHDFNDLIKELEKFKGEDLFRVRLRFQKEIQDLVESIEVYNKGNIEDQKTFEKKVKTLGQASRKRLEEIRHALKDIPSPPFFVVNYRNGTSRVVMPSADNGKSPRLSMKLSEDGLLTEEESEISLG